MIIVVILLTVAMALAWTPLRRVVRSESLLAFSGALLAIAAWYAVGVAG